MVKVGSTQPAFISSLQKAADQIIETHISWVLLIGEYAYKIKKPVNLGFLDFSTLEKRKFYCEEELRLNQRLAPSIYLEVIAVTGMPAAPEFGGDGEVMEYAVKMHRFPQQAQLDNMLEKKELLPVHMESIAEMIASFHEQAAIAGSDTEYGSPESIFQPVRENFLQIRDGSLEARDVEQLKKLEHWSVSRYEELLPVLTQRKQDGFVRECHGDLHLRNLVWYMDRPMAFDCIEFAPALRWIDTISEVAFLYMDLQERGQDGLAQGFLNAYLENCGDYAGLGVLRFYLVYRALVRAKVEAIRSSQQGINAQQKRAAQQGFSKYMSVAMSYIQPSSPKLIITHGMSASGKSTVSRSLLEVLQAIRIRSDVERKRLFETNAAGSTHGINAGIYSSDASQQTYQKLEELAASVLDAGSTVIVDAAFLEQKQRQPFFALAQRYKVAFVILDFVADADTLRRRILARKGDVSDADLSVLEYQLAHSSPLTKEEQEFAVRVDTEEQIKLDSLVKAVNALESV